MGTKLTRIRDCINILNKPETSFLLISLIVLDLLFILFHYLNALTSLLNNDMFSIGMDRGFPEIFQYFKYSCIVAFLLSISFYQKSRYYLVWVVLFTYFLLDDFLRIHDQFGYYLFLNMNFSSPPGLLVAQNGELIISALIGIVFLLMLSWAWKRGDLKFRKVSKDYLLLVMILVFFGVIVDIFQKKILEITPLSLQRGVNSLFVFFEDGGEMISVSLILWYTFLLKSKNCDPGCHLWNLVKMIAGIEKKIQ